MWQHFNALTSFVRRKPASYPNSYGPGAECNSGNNISVTLSGACGSKGTARRLEVTTRITDGLMCELVRLFEQESLDVLEADAISDGEYMFVSCSLKAPDFSSEAWEGLVRKVESLLHLSRCGVAPEPQMYEVAVATTSSAEGLQKVLHALQCCGLQVVQSSMHRPSSYLASGHPVLAMAPSCELCELQSSASVPSAAADGQECHLQFFACDVLHVLPAVDDRELLVQHMVNKACRALGVSASHVSVREAADSDLREEDCSQLKPQCCVPQAPQMCWQRPTPAQDGLAKCPFSHLHSAGSDGRRRFVSDALPEQATNDILLHVDDTMGHAHNCTCIEIQCCNRQGLLFDVLWTLHSMAAQLVQARIQAGGHSSRGNMELQLFVRDRSRRPFEDERSLNSLLECVMRAIALPVSVSVVPGDDSEGTLEVLLFSMQGPGARLRPNVVSSVVSSLKKESMKVVAAFVGTLDDQTVQENVPGDALTEIAATLPLPLLQRNNAVATLPAWHGDGDNEGLAVHTARDTCSNSSLRLAESYGVQPGSTGTSSKHPLNDASSLRPYEEFSHSSDEDDASSMTSSCRPRDIPILHDLERAFDCPFLEEEAPYFGAETPTSVSVLQKIDQSLPKGLLSSGILAHDTGKGTRHVQRSSKSAFGKEVPPESMLSSFGEASMPICRPSDCRHLVETHHFVVQLLHDTKSGGSADAVKLKAAKLKQVLEAKLELVPVACGHE